MSHLFTNIGVMLLCFFAMEAVAFLSHKYVMHGFLWCWHESHHTARESWFEQNDLFAFMFAVPSIAAIWFGTNGQPLLLWAGIGIALYGLVYFIFHDVIVHRRIRTGYIRKARTCDVLSRHIGCIIQPRVKRVRCHSGLFTQNRWLSWWKSVMHWRSRGRTKR